jgi:glycine/D-amino acid oxidase-like deaminating enzyme
MPFAAKPRPQSLKALAATLHTPFWLDDPQRPDPAPSLTSDIETDLLVIGGGFSGLWTALLAREADPAREVVLIEAGQAAQAASGRNGGFMVSSLTHGLENGRERWPKELPTLSAMGHANLQEIAQTIQRHAIDCDFILSGELNVATEPYQVAAMRDVPQQAAQYGQPLEWLDQEALRQQVRSPLYLGALFMPNAALVNPARLGWGLREACLRSGVRIFEHSPAAQILNEKAALKILTPYGSIRARRVALATNAFPPLLKHLRHYIVPVYDYVLMSEPLSAAQRAEIGWDARQGIGDSGNQFHYTRTTADGRILFGGYDAVYYWNNGIGPHLETNWESFGKLAEHFFETFPQLDGLRFSHAWGGAIDTCSRFSPFWGTAHNGRLAYSVGFTGLGVASTRFGAQIMLDLLDGRETARTKLEMTRSTPLPFPPEPLRSGVINFTRWSLDRADQQQGRRNLWLRTLDALGLGFDS